MIMTLVGQDGVGIFAGVVAGDRSQEKWLNKGRDETEAIQLSALKSYDYRKCTAQDQMELGPSFKARRLVDRNPRTAWRRCKKVSQTGHGENSARQHT